LTSPSELILASTSPYRRTLLERLRLPFRAVASQVDEAHRPGEAPAARSLRLAVAKAAAVAERHPEAAIIGSDQVAVCGERVLDKPGHVAAAIGQLRSLSGQVAHFHTAVAVQCLRRDALETFTDITEVRFRALSDAEIARYVELERPFDCAGSFRSEALGCTLFDSVRSEDPTGLIGLPMIRVAASLRRLGFALP
jgi:septum formation protein